MNTIFAIVYSLLIRLSSLTGLTYNEINIVVYYAVIPFIYLALIDKILKKHILKILFVISLFIFLFSIKDFRHFSDWLFDISVVFLLEFEAIGINYIASSVLICVFFPFIVFLILYYYAFKDNEKVKFVILSLNFPTFTTIFNFLSKVIRN